ncbi:sulfite exporter TauE/SafE family protein [Brachybacterium sp. YJGR34]|uniref:sulfite exporter TauE/SafE family protein n=1 Tax=Brachybacterium sp. YJGR34 TaxID=2059911 RepID=UPI000E0BD068|nr:sulfite exporter TauE/SafE family protein [Brachybacterium sp. YJGR34]
MALPTLVLLATIIATGAAFQRLTGMGFALLASPFLVLALGPFEGILVTNLCGLVSSLLNLSLVHRDVEWRRLARFTPFSIVGIGAGTVLLRILPADPLAILVGVSILLAIALTVFFRSDGIPDSLPLSAGCGAASGIMNVTAGVGGPALAVYAAATRWPHRGFAASAQVHFAAVCLLSLAAKATLPSFAATGWVVTVAAILAGTVVGQRLAGRFSDPALRRLVILLSTAGAVVTIVEALV